jgi:PKD repeat protein
VLKKACLYALVLGFLCASAYAQLWPLPSYTTPDTPVPCSLCQGSALNMPTPGWHDPVVAYVGRFVSSEYVGDFQQGYRTARANGIVFSPDGTRLAVKLGQGVAMYSTSGFLASLERHDPMVSVSTLGVATSQRSFGGDYLLETYLPFEHYFYAENSKSGWQIQVSDGQDRLGIFDLDDRGLVYIGYDQFSWGIATENNVLGGSPALMSSWQDKNAFKYAPMRAATWVKDGADYYALAWGATTSTVTHVFKVPTYSTPTEVRTINTPITTLVRLGTRSAILTPSVISPVYIFDNHTLVNGGDPLVKVPYAYGATGLVTDGTYWWTATTAPNGTLALSRISPDGTHTEFATPYTSANSLAYGGGFLSVVTLDKNIHLFKVTAGTPVEQPQPTSIANYYKNQVNFAPLPAHMSLQAAFPLVANGKLYLIIDADGIGDVYQLRTDDMVSVNVNGTTGPANPNAPAKAAGDVFYGDTINLLATLSSGTTGGNLSWNYGAPHDPANLQGGIFGSPTSHHYTGLSKADVVAPLTISATNPLNGVVGNAQLTLKTGTARVKYGSNGSSSTKYLTGSGAPVMMDDYFYDASDGDTTGHYAEWRLGPDAATIAAPSFIPTYTDPVTGFPAAGCGQHTLSMTAHYGYTAFSASNVDFPVPIPSPFTYTATAFAPSVDVSYNSATGNEEFFSTSRAAAALAGRTFSYTWDVVDANGTTVAIIPPQSGSATSADQIPRYNVSKSLFAAAGYKGRLVVGVSGVDPCSQTGAPLPSQQATSNPLVTPDAQLNASCSQNVCTYTITSPSNVLTSDGWTFAWTATGGLPASGNSSALTTTYNSTGNFPVNVTVTNKTGLSKQLTYTANITFVPPSCPTFTASNTGITYQGTSDGSTCVDGSACSPNEPITFSLLFFQINPDSTCLGTLTYQWKVDNVAAGTGSTLSTSFSSGSHVVSLTLKAGTQTIPFSRTLTIGVVQQPPPPPPPTQGCPTLSALNTTLGFRGQTSTCSGGSPCQANETIVFDVSFFNYSCSSQSYSWSFDGAAGVVGNSEITHSFSTAGNHTVACTVTNSTSHVTVNATVNVGGSTTPACPTLTVGQNIFLNYTGGTSGCSNVSSATQCKANEQITFVAQPYQYTCSTASTYSWTVDNALFQSTTDTAVVTLTSGTHVVSVTVDNGNPTKTTLSQTISVGNPITANYTFDFSITPLALPPNSYAFTVTVTPDSPSKPTQWQWNFGDGSPAVTAGAIQTHTFPDDKEYTVTVTATDGTGGVVSHKVAAPPARRRAVAH